MTDRSPRASRAGLILVPLLLLAALTACGSENDPSPVAPTAASSSSDPADDTAATEPPADAEPAVTLVDPWVAAAPQGVTEAYGVLVNRSTQARTLVSVSSDVTDVVELHETVVVEGGQMLRPVDGLEVPPQDGLALLPGEDGITLVNVERPLEDGDEVALTLTFDDGSSLDVVAPVRG
ncbi:MAG: hypothetical protein CMH83_11655 [Nocardioides sp.]|nr:hypothetical protein [Nocardioides sp.]